MTAEEARDLDFRLHKLPKYFELIKKAIEAGQNHIIIDHNLKVRAELVKLGYFVQEWPDGVYESKAESYKVIW